MEGDKKKILIIDDDTFLLDMYAFKFSQSSFEVFTAPDGEKALGKINDGLRPDILLVDVVMPNMDGFEFLENLNKKNLLQDIARIILSNKNQQVDVDRGNSLGVDGYIFKASSTPSEVIQQVLEILEKRKQKLNLNQ